MLARVTRIPRLYDEMGRPDGYQIRRSAVDGVPLVTDLQLARALVEALRTTWSEGYGLAGRATIILSRSAYWVNAYVVTGSQVKLPRRGISATEDALVMHALVINGAGGGPEKTIVNSPGFLVDEGYPLVCAYIRDPNDPYFPELLKRAEAKLATILPVDDNGPLDWKVIDRFNQLIDDHKPVISPA